MRGEEIIDFPQQGDTIRIGNTQQTQLINNSRKIFSAGPQKPLTKRDAADLFGPGEVTPDPLCIVIGDESQCLDASVAYIGHYETWFIARPDHFAPPQNLCFHINITR